MEMKTDKHIHDRDMEWLKSADCEYIFNFWNFLIHFYVPFKIISAHMRRANQ